MKSPFPGMDPYLEQHWRDVHQSLVTYLRDALQPCLPSDLIVRAEERVYVSSEMAARGYREIYPDVRIVETEPLPLQPEPVAAAVAVAEPVVIELDAEPMTEGYLQVLEVGTDRVVTTIEVLSATNKKPGDGSRQYRQKQRELEVAGIGLVEIDLLRDGQRVLRVPENTLQSRLRTQYRVCVTRGWQQSRVLYYAIGLRSRLPAIKIPLRQTDEDAIIELQPLIEQAYRNGRYSSIDYREECRPPLAGEDAVWANDLLHAAGRR